MVNKISNFVFLILLFVLQSCSGGSIGNFLESSFKTNNNIISENDVDKKLESGKISDDRKLVNKKDKNPNIKINDEAKPLNIVNTTSVMANDTSSRKKQIQNFNPKSYRVFVILKKVDPSFPTENFSKVLRDGDINFEIEKIELMTDLNLNKQ